MVDDGRDARKEGLLVGVSNYDHISPFLGQIQPRPASGQNRSVSCSSGSVDEDAAYAENFIREQEYGFDLKHYPCQKLDANRAYGLIETFAYNLMRLTALQVNPKKPGFAKKTRR